jgi:hypothetical protein
MASLLDLLQTKGSVYTKLDGITPENQYSRDMTDNQSLHQVNGPDLTKSVLDLDAKKPEGYQNPETGTTYP